MSHLRLSFSALVITGILFTVACGPQSEDSSMESNTSTVEQLEGSGGGSGVGQFCGGFAGIPCPEGLVCVDDPRDTCNPHLGGRDCGGICVGATTAQKKCDYKDPTRRYVSRDPATCAAIFFVCQEGESVFFNECGCGCVTAQ
ncbi:hypothetical protein [Archangium sp.]|uniref:hypothetical protein n=1 Tax=Archangium sp. TaxID=1872627 RepID=UPI002D4A6C0E|nr:hypothetical protein [Archangium sp.]HYO51501.1 hypothetical protein [Archangium sp.]